MLRKIFGSWARYKGTPLACRFSLVGQGFIPCRQIFSSARCKTAPYIKPIFLCRAGFYTPPTKFFSARCKTAPYIKPIFISVGQSPTPRISARREPRPPIVHFRGHASQRADFSSLGQASALLISGEKFPCFVSKPFCQNCVHSVCLLER